MQKLVSEQKVNLSEEVFQQMVVTNDSPAVAEFILKNGANADSKDIYGRTTIYRCTESSSPLS